MDKTGKGRKLKGGHRYAAKTHHSGTGISKSALGKYEADDFKDISPFSMVELAKFYGVSTDYLLGLTEQKITQTQSWTLCIWVMMQSKY